MKVPPPDRADRLPLTRDRIIDTALDLARQEGLAGVSMRKVAGALGVEAMSLYHHIPSKTTLMVLMADRSIAAMPTPSPTLPWHSRLVELLVQTYLAAVDNPAIFPILASEPLHPDILLKVAGGGPSLGLLERVLACLDEGQVPVGEQVHVFRGLVSVVVGFVVAEVDGFLPAPRPGDEAKASDTSTEPSGMPLLERLRPELEQADPVQSLRLGLELFLRGLSVPTGGSRPEGNSSTTSVAP